MRASLLGVCLGKDRELLRAYVRASTRLTHIDPRTKYGSFRVALAAHHRAMQGPQGVHGQDFLQKAGKEIPEPDEKLQVLLSKVEEYLQWGFWR